MFDIGWTELLVIGIVALIVIGPRELPKTLRTIGQMMTKVRRMASEFQGQFNEAIREAELDELRKEAEKLSGITDPLGNFDPLATVKSEIESAVDGKAKSEPAATTEPAVDPVLEQIESANAPNDTAPAEAAVETPASGGGRAA
jgi:sec-independent protein translocase protein TatB